MGASDELNNAETISKSIRVVKKAKKVLKKQDDCSMKIDLLANTVLEKLKKHLSTIDEVKKLIKNDEIFEISADGKYVCISGGKKRKRKDKIDHENEKNPKKLNKNFPDNFRQKDQVEKGDDVDSKVKDLEALYREALAAFKADKTNKDLRRAKSAARKAWDSAVAETQDGIQLTCKDCSQSFMFSDAERKFYEDHMSFDSKPTRCQKCNQSHKIRCKERRKQDGKNIKGKNMCWAFQQGKCTHGDKCKFSHNPDFSGKAKEKR